MRLFLLETIKYIFPFPNFHIFASLPLRWFPGRILRRRGASGRSWWDPKSEDVRGRYRSPMYDDE